jgi:prepilin-type N-terminal cleavage/methylation domain-containing protein
MKLLFRNAVGFTIIELLVCIVIIGVFISLLIPKVTDGDTVRGEMVGVLSQMRQLHLATQVMALDTKAAKGEGMEWTMLASHGRAVPVSLAAYFDALVKNNYLTRSDLRKLLSAPGKQPTEDDLTARSIAFKIFQVDGQSPSDQPLFVTANWQPTGLTDHAPYGKKGFVVFAKGGSGGIYKRPTDVTSPNLFPPASQDSHPYRYLTLE